MNLRVNYEVDIALLRRICFYNKLMDKLQIFIYETLLYVAIA